jgi:starch synthase
LPGAVCRAFMTFARKRVLNIMRRNAMGRAFSWQASAANYIDLYRRCA